MKILPKYRKSLMLFAVFFIITLLSNWRVHLFNSSYSTIALAQNGELLGASIASDGQWRFPATAQPDPKYMQCLIAFEDQTFYGHDGIYLPSILRAISQNWQQKKIVSGGSTITMQLARISRGNPARTWFEKLIESVLAWQIEQSYTKSEILALYAAHAPFGGNVVGLDAAAWRYYGRSSKQLSWAENATLAALPNAPSLIYPGKSQHLLLEKRDFILIKLNASQQITLQELELAQMETLPQKPTPLPQFAPHLLQYLMLSHPNQKSFQTTIDPSLQKNASRILAMHMPTQQANNVHNCAALIVEIKTGKVLMYHGNSPITDDAHSRMVDIIHAPRSTGSILKPVLYAAMLQEGAILPETLIEDIPIQFNGFTPKNYFETYDGLVPASNALSRSLNIPAVVMLKDYGYPRFVNLLQRLGLKDIDQPADHYGLSVILGGAESNLWDLTKLYAGLGRTLHSHQINADHEWTDNYEFQTTLQNDHSVSYTSYSPISPSAIWCTYQSLMAVNRPDTELGWEAYNSSQPIAWKTGTSFGNRDAWAIGSSSEYVVSVWVGNADGTGRPGLTGVQAAAPILFDLFKLLDLDESFIQPTNSLIQIETCSQSGMRKGPHCLDSKWQWAPVSGLRTNTCGYHQLLFLDPVSGHQVTSECFSPHLMISRSHFVVPPAHAHYFKNKNPEYQNAPPYLASCDPNSHPLDILYPRNGSSIFLPVGLNGQTIPIVLQATHLHDQQLIYWHLDNTYIGETKEIHQIEITPSEGQHQLVITDTAGHRSTVTFQVIKNNTK